MRNLRGKRPEMLMQQIEEDFSSRNSFESTREGKCIRTAEVGFADLGMEAIYEFDVVDMPVTVAVDAAGTSVHNTGPAEWQKRIATGEFKGIAVSAG